MILMIILLAMVVGCACVTYLLVTHRRRERRLRHAEYYEFKRCQYYGVRVWNSAWEEVGTRNLVAPGFIEDIILEYYRIYQRGEGLTPQIILEVLTEISDRASRLKDAINVRVNDPLFNTIIEVSLKEITMDEAFSE